MRFTNLLIGGCSALVSAAVFGLGGGPIAAGAAFALSSAFGFYIKGKFMHSTVWAKIAKYSHTGPKSIA